MSYRQEIEMGYFLLARPVDPTPRRALRVLYLVSKSISKAQNSKQSQCAVAD